MKKNIVISKGIRSLHKSSPLGCQSCQEYLDYCRFKSLDIGSTVFRGTLYELLTKKHLIHSLHGYNLKRKGGAFDEGVDIHGNWDLSFFWENLKKSKITATRLQFGLIQPLVKKSVEFQAWKQELSKNSHFSITTDVNILVQCKNHDAKIGAKTIRELAGIYHLHFRQSLEVEKTFMFLFSPRTLTLHAVSLADSLNIPLIHVCLSELKFQDGELFNLSSWSGGKLEAYYMNFMARSLLKGLDVELQMKKALSYT